MTIKEVEQLLDIPRATVRYYEKEGLITPYREGNAYRNYSEDDIEKLKKIIILRKIGVSVEDINDLFDDIKSMDEVLDENIANLELQMEELQGALKLSKRMQDDQVEISEMDTAFYWNTVKEEEESGNLFLDLTKDIVHMEKIFLLSRFTRVDEKGKSYISVRMIIITAMVLTVAFGLLACMIANSWSMQIFSKGIIVVILTQVAEMILLVPLLIPIHFLGKKFHWDELKKHIAVMSATCLVCIIYLIYLVRMF